jgi:hypothetical protein
MSDDKLTSAFRALVHPYRRQLLLSMSESESPDQKFDPPGLNFTVDGSDAPEPVSVHQQLWLLEEAGYITFDQHSHTVERGPKWDEIQPLLRMLHTNQAELPTR